MTAMVPVQTHILFDLELAHQHHVTQAAVLKLSVCQLMMFACHLVPAKCNQSSAQHLHVTAYAGCLQAFGCKAVSQHPITWIISG